LPPGTLTGAAHNALLQLSVAPGSIIVWHDYGRFGINGVSRKAHLLQVHVHEAQTDRADLQICG